MIFTVFVTRQPAHQAGRLRRAWDLGTMFFGANSISDAEQLPCFLRFAEFVY